MKKATTVRELKQCFRHNGKLLSEADYNVYVELYPKQMKRLSEDIEDTKNLCDTFYVTGQSGNGKTTALFHLKNNNEYIKNNYIVKYLMSSDIFDYNDKLTIVDILIMVGMSLIEDDEKLEEKYLKKLEELKEIGIKKATKNLETGVDIGFLKFFKFKSSLKRDWSSSEQTRIEFRKLFNSDRRELKDLINEIIKEYHFKLQDKKLFLILDDLEKRNVSTELFTIHKDLIEKLQVLKVVIMPINYATSGKVYKLGLRVKSNPLVQNPDAKKVLKDKEEIAKNLQILKDLIYNRIDDNHRELIPNTDNILKRLIDFSGCNIRQLLRLIAEAAASARYNENETITSVDVDMAIEDLLNTMAIVTYNRQSFYRYIEEHNLPDENDEGKLKESIVDNTIFIYFNGQPWYDLNPIIKDYITKIGTEKSKPELRTKNRYIDNLQIKNYFSIKDIKLDNLKEKKEIYFVGENGDGKTIVLQALTLAYKDYDKLPLLAKEYINDIKNKYTLDTKEEKYINDNLYAYGINRNKMAIEEKDKSGYSGLFDTPSLPNTTFLNRPQDLYLQKTDLVDSFKNKIEDLLDNKIEILHICTISTKKEDILFKENGEKVKFKTLSEGYKSTIIWLSDLMIRLIENQPKVDKLDDFEAVVLIDEIDLYLHPKWKYNFVYKLRLIFPKIQFIMTTHSMTTILGASKDAVFYRIFKDKNNHTQITDQIDDISDYSANILSTSPIFNMKTAKARAYDNKYYLTEDDYEDNESNKKIRDNLKNKNNKDMKLEILKKLKESYERE